MTAADCLQIRFCCDLRERNNATRILEERGGILKKMRRHKTKHSSLYRTKIFDVQYFAPDPEQKRSDPKVPRNKGFWVGPSLDPCRARIATKEIDSKFSPTARQKVVYIYLRDSR